MATWLFAILEQQLGNPFLTLSSKKEGVCATLHQAEHRAQSLQHNPFLGWKQ